MTHFFANSRVFKMRVFKEKGGSITDIALHHTCHIINKPIQKGIACGGIALSPPQPSHRRCQHAPANCSSQYTMIKGTYTPMIMRLDKRSVDDWPQITRERKHVCHVRRKETGMLPNLYFIRHVKNVLIYARALGRTRRERGRGDRVAMLQHPCSGLRLIASPKATC